MNWLQANLVEPALQLLSQLDESETADGDHEACLRLSVGVEGLFRMEVKHRWAGWPPESTTDGSEIVVCTRSNAHMLTAVGLTNIDFSREQFPFKIQINKTTTELLVVAVSIGQLDSATGQPPRLSDTVLVVEKDAGAASGWPILLVGRSQSPIVWTEVLAIEIAIQPGPSRRLVAQRVRNRIIEALELSSSFEAQIEYRNNAPIAHVPAEVIEQWNDNMPSQMTDPQWDRVVFSPDERDAIHTFHQTWDEVATATPTHAWTLEQAQSDPGWERLRTAAESALEAFDRRGRLPEDREIQ